MNVMASVQMQCPCCGATLAIESEWAGMQIQCPQCNNTIQIPGQVQQPGAVEEVNMITALKKYAQFSGRSRRKEYWLFFLFNLLISISTNILVIVTGISILSQIVSLGLLVPSLAVAVRRLQDTGRSGLNLLWGLLPIIGWIILWCYFCQDSQPGTNQYGPNPKGC